NLFSMENDSVVEAIEALAKGKHKMAYLHHPDQGKLLEIFKHKLPLVVAAGGFVTNKKGKVLFIYRNDKWDLPKGKVDKGESIENAAMREVEEETGVTDLKIERFLKTTYHVFRRNGNYILKQVHWFAMSTSFDGKLQGQEEEGIMKVKWKGPKKVKKALEKSYFNIKTLFEDWPNP
ncbi:MAG: NUDIX domain-containing protein, partial [Bacteroidota bacterium]